MEIQNRIGFVTGGASGIGRATVVALAGSAERGRSGAITEGYAGPATPSTWPSGSAKWPTTRSAPGFFSGPNRRVPPRLSALWSAASTSGTPT